MKLILGFTGEKAGGKGTAAAYLKERYGASAYRFSDPLTRILEIMDIPNERPNYTKLFEVLSAGFGANILARAIAQVVGDDPHDLIIVDGVRRMPDIENLKQLSGWHLIYITADPRLRYERARSRAEKPNEITMSFEDFLREDATASTEVTIKDTAALAELTIENNGTKEELYRKLDQLVAETFRFPSAMEI